MKTSRGKCQRMHRRQAVSTMLNGILPLSGLAALPRCLAEELTSEAGQSTPGGAAVVVDTHLHCFAGRDDSRFSYHPRAPYRPSEKATPQHLLRCMSGAGVDYAIVVHPEPYQDDHRYLEHCLQVGAGRLKGTCLFFADRPSSLSRMAPFLRRNEGKIVATRLHAYAPGRLPPFEKPELDELWRTATDHGIAMQLHFEPRYAAALDPYLRKYRQTRVIIDHLGRPMQGTPAEHAVVMRWSELPNTIMKLSAIPSRRNYPHREVGPIIKKLTDAWGTERLIYGGGFGASATPLSYRNYRNELRTHLAHLTAVDQAKVFGENAARLFQFC